MFIIECLRLKIVATERAKTDSEKGCFKLLQKKQRQKPVLKIHGKGRYK